MPATAKVSCAKNLHKSNNHRCIIIPSRLLGGLWVLNQGLCIGDQIPIRANDYIMQKCTNSCSVWLWDLFAKKINYKGGVNRIWHSVLFIWLKTCVMFGKNLYASPVPVTNYKYWTLLLFVTSVSFIVIFGNNTNKSYQDHIHMKEKMDTPRTKVVFKKCKCTLRQCQCHL